MKVLIVGYGSIGKKHYEILHTFEQIDSIDLITKQKIEGPTSYTDLTKVPNLNIYDYFIIASITSKHYEQLQYICSHTKSKIILVEKPLYDKQYKDIQTDNQIFIAYNLRFHPIISTLRALLNNETVYYANVFCGQYLPTWRPSQDYRKSYSASKKEGGGVLRDLSHELDYALWLFGDIEQIDTINTKISDLEIDSDDIFSALIVTNKHVIVNLTVDYISKVALRKLTIHTKNHTYEADLIQNTLIKHSINTAAVNIEVDKPIDSNSSYLSMHKNILNKVTHSLCSYTEGKRVLDIIDNIEFKEIL